MNNKLNGWNNNLTPFDGVGGKPGYHEKIPIMTPEQQKAKEIVEKYIKIIGSECLHESYCDRPECNKLGYTFCLVDYAKAKACAIEEVKAVIKAFDEANAYDLLPSMEYYEKVLTEIEKL